MTILTVSFEITCPSMSATELENFKAMISKATDEFTLTLDLDGGTAEPCTLTIRDEANPITD